MRQPLALTGIGGIGKSQIVLEYVHRNKLDYQIIFWFHASPITALTSQFAAVAELLELKLPVADSQNQDKKRQAVCDFFSTKLLTRWLFVFDNVDSAHDLELLEKQYIPLNCHGHVLITTRMDMTGTAAKQISVGKMPIEEGATFLLRRANIIDFTDELTSTSEDDQRLACELTETLDGHPLALDQAGAYLDETKRATLSGYLARYKIQGKKLRRRRGDFKGGYPDSVAGTLLLSLSKIQEANSVALEILNLFAFLAPDAILEEIITKGATELGPRLRSVAADPLQLDEAIHELLKYSLINVYHQSVHSHQSVDGEPSTDQENQTVSYLTYSLHRLVQAVVQDEMDKRIRSKWAERAVRAVNLVFPEMNSDTPSEQGKRYSPHAFVCATLIEEYGFEFVEASNLLNTSAYYVSIIGLDRCVSWRERALAIVEKQLGPAHILTLTRLNRLAELYILQRKYGEAESLYQRALVIYEQQLGPEHPRTVTVRKNYESLISDMKSK